MRRIALALIRLLAWLVPRSSRARWSEEWRAEIDHAAAASPAADSARCACCAWRWAPFPTSPLSDA